MRVTGSLSSPCVSFWESGPPYMVQRYWNQVVVTGSWSLSPNMYSIYIERKSLGGRGGGVRHSALLGVTIHHSHQSSAPAHLFLNSTNNLTKA